MEQVAELKADGKSTIEVTLKSGNADFPYVLSNFNMCIVPKGATDFNKGVGTGPYVLEQFEPGVRCFVKRNPNYLKRAELILTRWKPLPSTTLPREPPPCKPVKSMS